MSGRRDEGDAPMRRMSAMSSTERSVVNMDSHRNVEQGHVKGKPNLTPFISDPFYFLGKPNLTGSVEKLQLRKEA